MHADGRRWLHTGDLPKQDTDRFFYFSGRLERMIKTSDFNVYPTRVEGALYQYLLVVEACVVVPDPARIKRVKAYYVVLNEASQANPEAPAGHDAGKPPA